MTRLSIASAAGLCALLLVPAQAHAQAPTPEPETWTVALGAGLALTSGNTDTSILNASYDPKYDSHAKNIVKSDGLAIRGKVDKQVSAERIGLNARDEYKLDGHAYVFGQNQYLRDRFKDIEYLLAPAGGIGYRLLDSPVSSLTVDAGVGGVWEKDTGFDVTSSGAVTVGEKLAQTLTKTTLLSESYAGLWKSNDFDNSLHLFDVGVAAAMSMRTQLKVEVLDTYKNKPSLASLKKNDLAVLVTIVYKR